MVSVAARRHVANRNMQRRNPDLGMTVTHRFTPGDNPLDCDILFPDRTVPVSFLIRYQRTGAANGLLFELGSDSRGLAVAVDGTDLIVGAGLPAASDEGATITAAGALPDTKVYKVLVAVNPQAGAIQAYVSGVLVGSAVAVNGTFQSAWASTGSGAVAALEGTCIDRIPVGQRVALADAQVVGPVLAFNKQLPRSFDAFGMGTDNGNGSYTL